MAWYNNSWKNRIALTIDHTKVGASLTNFPVYVNLADLPAGFFSSVRSDGGDIRITQSDGLIELAREIVAIDTVGKTGELHFNGNSLSNSANTTFYIYFNNPSATNYADNATYGKYNVWDSNYSAVWHMSDGADTSHIGDSTSNQLTGTKVGAANPSVTTGKLGKAQSFNGTTSYITIADNAVFDPTAAITLEAWVNHATTTNNQRYLSKNLDSQYRLAFINASNGIQTYISGIVADTNTPFPTTATWYQYVGTYNGATAYTYKNGAADAGSAGTGAIPTSTATLYMGQRGDNTNDWFDGLLDEIRISKIARASTWISTQYNNQNSSSTFYTPSGVQSNGNASFLLNFL